MNEIVLTAKQGRLALVVLISFLLGCSPNNNLPRDHLPRDHLGNTVDMSKWSGHWVVINYWAKWCKPCIEEIPELNALAQSEQHKLLVLGVDYDQQQGEKLQQAISKLGIQFPVLLQDPFETLGYSRPQVLPTTIIINPKGELQQTLIGPQTQETLEQAMARQ